MMMPHHTMRLALPPADALLSAGAWAQLLAQRITDSSTIEWLLRFQGVVHGGDGPRPRYPNGVPVARHQLVAGGSPWFSSADVAAWLAGMGFVAFHEAEIEPPFDAPSLLEREAPTVPASSPTEHAWLLEPKEVANAFRDLRGWSEERWRKELGDPPDWLVEARRIAGQQGVRAALWDPVPIADALVRRFSVPVRSVRARFQREPALQQWLPGWIEHQATYWPDE
ncbi:hypothetical protein HHL11_07105 [Ramlibacter sp. G-1-2-2]|uniref:Uncharacterized protein n=1 Tax=Ramlibacter agri TaxID=2728837 RepID=A0A848H2Y1_9BURK|nr:hypothetical protein [Ramlibacter agri]NML43510.1 hypothetical protein [Ramlibacter agri]